MTGIVLWPRGREALSFEAKFGVSSRGKLNRASLSQRYNVKYIVIWPFTSSTHSLRYSHGCGPSMSLSIKAYDRWLTNIYVKWRRRRRHFRPAMVCEYVSRLMMSANLRMRLGFKWHLLYAARLLNGLVAGRRRHSIVERNVVADIKTIKLRN